MKYRYLSIALLAAAAYVLLFVVAAPAVAIENETEYYTLIDQERYTLIHEVRLNNYGLETAYDINLSIPLMDKETPVYSRKLREQIEPWPDRIETDVFGRRMAHYHLDELPPGVEAVFIQKYVLDAAGIRYDNAIANETAGYDEQFASYYLLPSANIESDHEEIIAFAKAAAGRYTNPYDVASAAFVAVNQYMSYVKDDFVYRGALSALRRKQGVCEDYSSLYVAVLRALGIAARQQGGYLYLPYEHTAPPYFDMAKERVNLNQLRHTWVEFYIPGQGWVIADPTYTHTFEVNGVLTKFPNWQYFATIPQERRYLFFFEGSVNENRGKMNINSGNKGGYVETSLINGYLAFGSQAAYYNDLPGHWAEAAIMRLSEREEPLLQGMGNGMFGVNQPMTRAQLVTCLQRLLKSPAAGPKFTDVKPEHWAYRDIGAAQQGGWLNGYPDGSFRPDQAVSRAELARLLVDVFELSWPEEIIDVPVAMEQQAEEEIPEDIMEQQALAAFEDLGLPGYAWADEAISILAALGLTQGSGNGLFQPQRPVTRGEFATFLDRIIETYVQEN